LSRRYFGRGDSVEGVVEELGEARRDGLVERHLVRSYQGMIGWEDD
jgi:hypothetical protein